MEAGLFAVVVALPLVFAPVSAALFSDPKFVVLFAGCLLVGLSRPSVDRRIVIASAIWILTVALAAVFGLDPWWSVLGAENRGTGLLAYGACAVLLCAGTGVGEDLRARLPTWLFWSGASVSVVAVAGRFVRIGGQSWELGSLSSTLGHRVFVGGFVAAAIIAATSLLLRPATFGGLLVLGSGLAVTAARSAWVGAALGLLVVVPLNRGAWKKVLAVLVPVILAVAGWTLADRVISAAEKDIEFSAAPRFTQLDEGSAQERLPAIRANLRAWADDPLLGSGPGTGWFGYLNHVSPGEMRRAGRGFGDAHNLLVEMGTTTGTLGAGALVVLGLLVLVRARHPSAERSWALGAAVALGVVHALQPFNLVLTPLMFLTAGLAVTSQGTRTQLRRWVAALVALGLVATSARLVASSFELYGSRYASEAAYRWALRIEPWRLGASLALAEHRAFDHRTQDLGAAADARRLVQGAVRDHGWNPRVRLVAANVEVVLGNQQAARRWVDQHLEIFPNDPNALSGAAALALRAGDREEALSLARRALSLDPDLEQARTVLESARERGARNES